MSKRSILLDIEEDIQLKFKNLSEVSITLDDTQDIINSFEKDAILKDIEPRLIMNCNLIPLS